MLYFMVCADETAGVAAARERGWVQVGAGRFYTPQRDDVRVIRRFVDLVLMPGGTFLMAGPGFDAHPQRRMFDDLVSLGAAKWVEGEEPKAVPEPEAAQEVPAYEMPPPEPEPEPPLISQVALREQILGRPLRRREVWSPGGSRTPEPSRK